MRSLSFEFFQEFHSSQGLMDLLKYIDIVLVDTRPTHIIIHTIITSFLCISIFEMYIATAHSIRIQGYQKFLIAKFKCFPFVTYFINVGKVKTIQKIQDDFQTKRRRNLDKLKRLPRSGLSRREIMEQAQVRKSWDTSWEAGNSKMSGTVYMSNHENFEICNSIYSIFAHSNPLHGDSFPSVCRMEAEVIAMTIDLMGGGSNELSSVCGTMTSGGTESILTAIRASRNYMREKKGIFRPEMIAATSAHAAIYKAAEYFNIDLICVGVDTSGRMKISEVLKAITKNTILIYASAPSYPHGTIDPIEELAGIALRYNFCLHVDACLGGFVLPFAQGLKSINIPNFDFQVKGVTSISIDTHKYGCAQKGSSVVLYHSNILRQYQYTSVTDWSGGLYISPSQPGSRSGGLIAQTWAALLYNGYNGYQSAARKILRASKHFREQISNIPGLELLGADVTMVVAWTSKNPKLNIYMINDILSSMGWELSVLHAPPALHLCLTSANIGSLPGLIADLRTSVAESFENQNNSSSGMAPIYGLGNALPDRNLVGEMLKEIQDVMLHYS